MSYDRDFIYLLLSSLGKVWIMISLRICKVDTWEVVRQETRSKESYISICSAMLILLVPFHFLQERTLYLLDLSDSSVVDFFALLPSRLRSPSNRSPRSNMSWSQYHGSTYDPRQGDERGLKRERDPSAEAEYFYEQVEAQEQTAQVETPSEINKRHRNHWDEEAADWGEGAEDWGKGKGASSSADDWRRSSSGKGAPEWGKGAEDWEKAREPAAVLMTGEGPPVAKELLSGAKAQEEREPAKATVAKVASQPKVEEVDHLMSRANKAVQGGIWTQKPNSSSSSCYNHRDKSLQTRCGPIKIMGPNL
jgi:hypothetical protein